MRLAGFLLAFSILCSCMPNVSLSAAAAAETNVAGLTRLQKGMTQAQVLKIMRHPYSDAVFVMDRDTYDVWFYITEPTVLGQSRMVPMNLTPLTFKNGILIGRGYPYYNYLKRRQLEKEIEQLAPPIEEIEQPKELENKPLENLLKESVPPAPPKSATPQTAPQSGKGHGKKEGGGTAPSNESPLHVAPFEPQTPSVKTPSAAPKASSKKGEIEQQTGPDWGPISPQSAEPQPESVAPSQRGAKTSKKQQGEPSSSPTSPNWGPLERQTQPVAPPSGEESQESGQSEVSMSKQPEKKAPPPAEKKPEKENLPLNEEDEEMLQEERDQDFNQT